MARFPQPTGGASDSISATYHPLHDIIVPRPLERYPATMFANVPLKVLVPYRSHTCPPTKLRLRFSGDLSLDITTFLRVAEADMSRYPFYFSYVLLRVHFLRLSCEGRGALWVDRFLGSGTLPPSLRSPLPNESIAEWMAANDAAWAVFREDMTDFFKDGSQATLRGFEQTGSVAQYVLRWRDMAEDAEVPVDSSFNCRWFIWGLKPAIRARFTQADWWSANLEHAVDVAQRAERDLNRAQRPNTFHASPSRRRSRLSSEPALSGLPSPIPENTWDQGGSGGRRRRATDLTYRLRSSESAQWAPFYDRQIGSLLR